MKIHRIIPLLVFFCVFSACDKKDNAAAEVQPAPTPAEETPAPTPTPTSTPTPTPEPIDKTSQVTVLGYHRFENPPKDGLAISTEDFRKQMQAIKDAGIEVISMADFLAWRRGEKNIPARSAIITIDDGYDCTYDEAWAVLKEFGYPFTFYIYTNYVGAGGRSISWGELAEMSAAGVDIGSHSISHDNMVRPKRSGGRPYEAWLRDELVNSKEMIEAKLGNKITTFAYPYGVQNEGVQQKGIEAGYEALFTVKGAKIGFDTPAAKIGRYVILSDTPSVFNMAINFGGSSAAMTAAATTPDPGIPTTPAHASTISNDLPRLEIDLSSLGAVDPKSLKMQVSGIGAVPVTWDAERGIASYQTTQRLHDPNVMVAVQAKIDGKTVKKRWAFRYQPLPLPERLATPVAESVAVEEVTASPETPAAEAAVDENLPPEATQPALSGN
ncbi:MAG: polysaccharide deacetylase family protein [Chthoniobacterales bacterium]